MKVPAINGSVTQKIRNGIVRADKTRNGRIMAQERKAMLEMAREKAMPPQPLHLIPELNILGLPKWM